MDIKLVSIEMPPDSNVIIGQTHFIKTAEDIYEAMVNSAPTMKFAVAFCEASQECLVRVEGNDEELKSLAAKNAMNIGAGHTFVILMKEGYPINVLNAIKNVPEVCGIFCATANEVEVAVCETKRGRGIIGVIDGEKPKGIEGPEHREERKKFLRTIGYKL
ncbi:MAG: adenosine-specific kinase [Methanomassiliicoccales archaeon]|nr:MAG: adenosine-specific kinase [Methanomassiliicoccales archaeon]